MTTKIYLVFVNMDMSEGRGPMRFVHACASKRGAKDYVDAQRGIGRPPEGMTLSDWCESGKDGGWGGYDIREVELLP